MVLRYTVIDPTKNITLLVTTPVQRNLQVQKCRNSICSVWKNTQVAFHASDARKRNIKENAYAKTA